MFQFLPAVFSWTRIVAQDMARVEAGMGRGHGARRRAGRRHVDRHRMVAGGARPDVGAHANQPATCQPHILAMQLAAVASLHGRAPSPAPAVEALGFMPFALPGAIAGMAVFRRLSNLQFQCTVSGLLVVSGIGMLARAL
jgi:hypothetical protein